MSSNTDIPVHGNYHGYYSKRPSSADHRLALLPLSIFQGVRVLDVGCNEGWVTCEIAQKWGTSKIVGVDIDETLVRAAWKRRRTVWSLQGPESHPNSKKRKRASDDRATPARTDNVHDYFPASSEHMFGALPIPPFRTSEVHTFPHNVSFRRADWVNDGIPEDAEGYDVVIAFSVSKWIHLNGGDTALMKFFRRVHAALKPGGTFILEPQLWDTYSKAKRMHPTLKENAKRLNMRPDKFEEVLQEMGFSLARHLGVAGEGGFKRPVDLYTKV